MTHNFDCNFEDCKFVVENQIKKQTARSSVRLHVVCSLILIEWSTQAIINPGSVATRVKNQHRANPK